MYRPIQGDIKAREWVARAMNTVPIFSSARHNWMTPGAVLADLDSEFGFDFDPCPTDPEFNGLECEVVALLPSRTGTDWFHECVLPRATEIRFIRGRLQFDDCGVNAPFDSMIIVYQRGTKL